MEEDRPATPPLPDASTLPSFDPHTLKFPDTKQEEEKKDNVQALTQPKTTYANTISSSFHPRVRTNPGPAQCEVPPQQYTLISQSAPLMTPGSSGEVKRRKLFQSRKGTPMDFFVANRSTRGWAEDLIDVRSIETKATMRLTQAWTQDNGGQLVPMGRTSFSLVPTAKIKFSSLRVLKSGRFH